MVPLNMFMYVERRRNSMTIAASETGEKNGLFID
jgi:hypothetical protein